MDTLEPKNVLKFIEIMNKLKHLPRQGWVDFKVDKPETVSGHMYAMAMMTFFLGENSKIDRFKCLQLALVHDLAECIVGDITPRDNISPVIKHKMESEAMYSITSLLGPTIGSHMYDLYREYEEKSTPEAKFVKDLDRFDMICTAQTYEDRDDVTYNLQDFFDSTQDKFEHPFIKTLVDELYSQRKKKTDETK